MFQTRPIWDPHEAERAKALHPQISPELALRIYSCRLIGQQEDWVLHGGGNCSLKATLPDLAGNPTACMAIKGSGWDMGQMQPAGMPWVRLDRLLPLRQLDSLSDVEMLNQLRLALLDHRAPTPSVETLLHAFLPHRYIDHTHADAVLVMANLSDGQKRIEDIFGSRLVCVPYIMPGFALAKACADQFEQNPGCEGLLLLQHGVFSFGPDAQTSFERMCDFVSTVEAQLTKVSLSLTGSNDPSTHASALFWSKLRGALALKGHSLLGVPVHSPALKKIAQDPALRQAFARGPMTPDHVIRIKQQPLFLGEDDAHALHHQIQDYCAEYERYFHRGAQTAAEAKTMLDARPIVVVHPQHGAFAFGRDLKSARIARDLIQHNAQTFLEIQALGAFQPVSESDLFDMEYWSLEQAKLGKSKPSALAGKVALITGAAGTIGAATAHAFAQAGAQLLLLDLPQMQNGLTDLAQELGGCVAGTFTVDLCDAPGVTALVKDLQSRVLGLNIVVSNAGQAFTGAMAEASAALKASIDVNLMAHQNLVQAVWPHLLAQGMGGCLLFNASKSAFNPGPDFGPYAVAKAGLIALMKQYALEGGPHGIRANAVNADRVRSLLLDPAQIEARALARGLDADAYYRSNLLGREVRAEDVAQAFLFLASAQATTGCTLTVDGGNIAASPR